MILSFDEIKAHSKAMQISFPLSLTESSTGLQKLIDFAPADFVQSNQQTSLAKAFIITQERSVFGITDILHHNVVKIGSNTVVTVDGVSNTPILIQCN